MPATEDRLDSAPNDLGHVNLLNHRYGSCFAIDYRRLTPEDLRKPERMVIQGIHRVLVSVPVWLLQRADQRVDEWPGTGMHPIFTQHLPDQWKWMAELLQEPEWPMIFQKDSKLVFSAKLTAACDATKSRDSSYYHDKIG